MGGEEGALSAGFSLELKAVFKIGCLLENFSWEETCHFGSVRFLCWVSSQTLSTVFIWGRGEEQEGGFSCGMGQWGEKNNKVLQAAGEQMLGY